jgi:enoyl-CoA hydratase/carnithine racemase
LGARLGRLESGKAFLSEFVFVSDPRPAARVVTLNRPEKKNALTRDMYDALAAVLKPADADGSVRVVCLAGSGDVFTAGNDIADFGGAEKLRSPSRLRITRPVRASADYENPHLTLRWTRRNPLSQSL